MSTLFGEIIRREIPADIVYEDDRALAFRDIAPQAPVHVLVIPKREIVNIGTMEEADEALVGHLLLICRKVAEQEGLAHYRVVANTGEEAGQSVFHLHFHLLGGRRMSWPPG